MLKFKVDMAFQFCCCYTGMDSLELVRDKDKLAPLIKKFDLDIRAQSRIGDVAAQRRGIICALGFLCSKHFEHCFENI